jgi:hypothetical protein
MTSAIAAPSEAFEAVKSSPPCVANWLAPAILFTVISWICTAILFSQPALTQQLLEISQQAMDKQAAHQHIPAEQLERIRHFSELSIKISAAVAPVFPGFAGPFVWGGFLWLIGAWGFKGGFTYMKAVEAVGLANVILSLEAIVKTLMILATNNVFAGPTLALLLGKSFDPQMTTHGILAALNLMTFWLLAARSSALARLSNISWLKAGACVFGVWVAYTGFFVAVGAAFKALMSRAGG